MISVIIKEKRRVRSRKGDGKGERKWLVFQTHTSKVSVTP